MKRMILLAGLLWGLAVAAADARKVEGRNYVLDFEKNIRVLLKEPDGTLQPFLEGIRFDASDREWREFYRSTGVRFGVPAEREGVMEIPFEYLFAGPDAALVSFKGRIEAHPDALIFRFDGRYAAGAEKLLRSRVVFRYAEAGQGVFNPDDGRSVTAGAVALKVEMRPRLRLFQVKKEKNTTANLTWEKDGGESGTRLELALIPFTGKEPQLPRLSGRPLEAAFEFARPYSVILEGDAPEALLHYRNRTAEKLEQTADLEIRDYRNSLVSSRKINLEAEPGQDGKLVIPLPEKRFGFFSLTLTVPGMEPFRHSCAVIPAPGRKYKAGSIFAGILYPWNEMGVDKLELMNWIGIGMIRRSYPIVGQGVGIPPLPTSGVHSPEAAELMLREHRVRGIEPVPRTLEALEMPPGTYRLCEGTNEENIRRLPADFAEQMKIEYVRAKLHDPALQVGSTGTAGVDILWWEEMQQSGAWDYMDALFVHLHCFPRAPEMNNSMTSEFWLHDRVTLLRALMDKYGEKPLFDSENGYLTRYPDRRVENYPLHSVSESDIAAAFMVRSYLQSLAYGLSAKMWFTIDSYGGFGITEYKQPLPAYAAYAAMTKLLDGAEYAGELLSPGCVSSAMADDAEFTRSWFGQATPGLEKELLAADRDRAPAEADPGLAPYVYVRAFRNPEKQPVLACWATLVRQIPVREAIDAPAWRGQKPGRALLWNGLPAEEAPKPVPVRFFVGVPEVEVADLMGNRKSVACENGFVTLELDDYPQFVLGASPELLKEAEKFRLTLFPKEFRANSGWKTLIQAVLPAEKVHPKRKSVFDKWNLSAELNAGKPYPVYVRLSNFGKEPERGEVRLQLPAGWRSEPESVRFSVGPGVEKVIVAEFQVTPDRPSEKSTITSIVSSDRLGKIADSAMNISVR